MTADEVRAWLSYYQDLGVTEIFRRESPVTAIPPQPMKPVPAKQPVPEKQPAPAKQPAPVKEVVLPPLAPIGDTLIQIQKDIGADCCRCRLSEQRSRIVFGVGNEQARLVFVGEGPGGDGDAQGIPF